MPAFFRKPYKSETSLFLEELKAQRPTLEAEQRAGRALLWDKAPDRSAQADYQAASVPQQPYVYAGTFAGTFAGTNAGKKR